MTNQDKQISELKQVLVLQSARLQRIESLFNFSDSNNVSDETLLAMKLLQDYYQTLPELLQEKIGVDIQEALEIMDELEDSGFINRSDIQEITDPEFVDELFEQVCEFLVTQDHCSPSYLQRKFEIGYNRAARIVDQLEKKRLISPANGTKPRKVYVDVITKWLKN
jgi:DNA segregation ATPase FtsK/SpoIIIE-like protein